MARLAKGGYGICETCGATIPPERLEIRPTTTQCVGCAEAGAHQAVRRGPVDHAKKPPGSTPPRAVP
ncbi:TraR/DksA family transcriptional regulator [Streptomyces sp. NPDC058459]|uniref:TraR/DksA family transcriptional regulator n=1 Tax=Streptomyces sp. NPDC058459 TaxID=3346508 RepID=UPI00364C2E62